MIAIGIEVPGGYQVVGQARNNQRAIAFAPEAVSAFFAECDPEYRDSLLDSEVYLLLHGWSVGKLGIVREVMSSNR